jgi:L,D-transpeptidase ErfK/SrfK
MKKFIFYCLFLCGFLVIANAALASRFLLKPEGDDLYGEIQVASVQVGDDFAAIARRYDVGYYELVASNPEVDVDHPAPGTVLIMPTQFLLPHVPRHGIVINLASMRLFYFPKGENYFYTYPIGIGREDWNTPLGELHIIQKIVNPVWVVPDSVMRFRQEKGDPVPKVVPPGPDNPLGKLAMRLSKPSFLIHDTNDVTSVGRRSSAGCIHLYPEDIAQLFSMTRVGTKVLIMNQPYMAAWNDNKLYVESHLPLEEQRQALSDTPAVTKTLIDAVITAKDQQAIIDWSKAEEIIAEHTGVPTVVGSLPQSSALTVIEAAH